MSLTQILAKKTVFVQALSDFKAIYILLLVVDLVDMIIIRWRKIQNDP